MNRNDTITAVATGAGGALAVIRMSGPEAIAICEGVFAPASAGRALSQAEGYTLHYGRIVDGAEVLDDVIVSLFRAPRSYTGEDMVEISCHGSSYIQRQIVNLLISKGARPAEAGEFTVRAFLAGKLDLSQAEAVADMIAATDRATHSIASTQMRGGYSSDLAGLRAQLVELVSLLELELDFGEEDVEFADRTRLRQLISHIEARVGELLGSFRLGNAIKEGVAVAIVGAPNVGKSTLLNTLLRDDRAMVSDIAGTTRDSVEESINIGGVRFRFIDTAGIRATDDTLEKMGIERTYSSIEKAAVVLYVVDAAHVAGEDMPLLADEIRGLGLRGDQRLAVVVNKIDKLGEITALENKLESLMNAIYASDGLATDNVAVFAISAKQGHNIDRLLDYLSSTVDSSAAFHGATVISNSRHYEALLRTSESLSRAHAGLEQGLAADLLSQDIREALHYLGTITGEITTDEILGSIFSKFCIGK